MRKIIFILTCLLLSTNVFSQENHASVKRNSEAEGLSGLWYGLYCGSPVTVSFSDKLQLAAEAFSSLNIDCNYELPGDGRISVPDAGAGMAGEGIYAIKDGTLELLFIFGASGQIQPLVNLSILPTVPESPTAVINVFHSVMRIVSGLNQLFNNFIKGLCDFLDGLKLILEICYRLRD